MKVLQVALRPTEQSTAQGRPALTPELLAATGARYSRNGEGLEDILKKVEFGNVDESYRQLIGIFDYEQSQLNVSEAYDAAKAIIDGIVPANMEASVDGIFRMLDYGHASVADMVPVALFMDKISIYLAYLIWSLCPQAGGQESSTRYIKMSTEGLPSAESLGLSDTQAKKWSARMARLFDAYERAVVFWGKVAAERPDLTRIPSALLNSKDSKDKRVVERMRRNYVFDRARYFLPAAAETNVMMIQSARAWSTLCQQLLSHPLTEAQNLGALIADEMGLAAPRMVRHATAKESFLRGQQDEFLTLSKRAFDIDSPYLAMGTREYTAPDTAFLEIHAQSRSNPYRYTEEDYAAALAHHDNRYAFMGEALRRTHVVFGWSAVAFGDIRDLNRHRTGNKFCPMIPLGFYGAKDQLPEGLDPAMYEEFFAIARAGQESTADMARELIDRNPANVYEMPLGAQFYFEHATQADKFLYEGELRTGTGSHFRYAHHLHDALELWFARMPHTRGLIQVGSAEPE